MLEVSKILCKQQGCEEECEPGRESGRTGLGPKIDNLKLLASV